MHNSLIDKVQMAVLQQKLSAKRGCIGFERAADPNAVGRA
jgi:hypothetical protein